MTEDNHPLTETKKQKAVRIWLEDEEKHLWTDAHIAEQCGVSIPFVSVRRHACTKFASPAKRKRLNKNGETVWKNTRSEYERENETSTLNHTSGGQRTRAKLHS